MINAKALTERIDELRQKTLANTFAFLLSVLEEYRSNTRICTLECDAAILGSLEIGLNEIGILPPPDPPFHDFSVKRVFQRLRKVKISDCCTDRSRYGKACYKKVMTRLSRKIEELEQQIRGLELE